MAFLSCSRSMQGGRPPCAGGRLTERPCFSPGGSCGRLRLGRRRGLRIGFCGSHGSCHPLQIFRIANPLGLQSQRRAVCTCPGGLSPCVGFVSGEDLCPWVCSHDERESALPCCGNAAQTLGSAERTMRSPGYAVSGSGWVPLCLGVCNMCCEPLTPAETGCLMAVPERVFVRLFSCVGVRASAAHGTKSSRESQTKVPFLCVPFMGLNKGLEIQTGQRGAQGNLPAEPVQGGQRQSERG